jgi:hypothetical protein
MAATRGLDGDRTSSLTDPLEELLTASTAPLEVRNNVEPLPRETNFTSESVCPRFASKLIGSFPYALPTRAVARFESDAGEVRATYVESEFL